MCRGTGEIPAKTIFNLQIYLKPKKKNGEVWTDGKSQSRHGMPGIDLEPDRTTLHNLAEA
jgi:hypothetical protein